MGYFLYRLDPPRPRFTSDMTPAEARLMQRHQEYWSGLIAAGKAIAFGPVADTAGSYDLGILSLAAHEDPRSIAQGDPALVSGLGFTCRIQRMPKLLHASPGGAPGKATQAAYTPVSPAH
jgi:uncharacterized protein